MSLLLVLGLSTYAFAGAVAVAPPSADVYAPRRVAVLIGVQEYTDPALAGLKFPAKDAKDLGAVLGSQDVGAFDRVFVIDGHDSTTREGLFRSIAVATADLQRDDTFVLYLAGHGTLEIDPVEGSQLYLLPSDGRLDAARQTGISVAEIESLVHDLPARRRVLILDTCHNGRAGSRSAVATPTRQLIDGFRGEPPAPRQTRDVSESEARLYAAQFWQPAMEDSELQNGVYTHFLIDALTGARGRSDLDEDGLVDVAEAHEYARDRTMTWTGGIQIPRAEYRIVGREEIFLAGAESLRATAERALLSAGDAIFAKAKLLVNGTARGELPGLYAVDPGSQLVEVESADGRTLLRERVNFRAGNTTSLETLFAKKQSSLAVLGGVSAMAGAEGLFPVATGATVVWTNPISLNGAWRTDIHIGGELASGDSSVAIDGGEVAQSTGALSTGLAVGLGAGLGWAGLSGDVRVPFRWSEYGRQAYFMPAGGIVAGLDFPISQQVSLATRLDGWAGRSEWEGDAGLAYGGGIRLGMATTMGGPAR